MHYLLMAVIGLVLLALAFRRSGRQVKAALFVATLASINVVDIPLVVFLHAYEYNPGLLSAPVLDNYMGELLGEFLFVPAMTAVVLGGLTPKRRLLGAPVLGILFAVMELWLVRTGEFRELRWSAWLTLLLFTVYGLLLGYGANRFERDGYTATYRLLLTTAATFALWCSWTMLTSALGRSWGIRFYRHPDPEADLGLGSLLLHALPFMLVAQGALRLRWLGSPAGLVTIAVAFTLGFYAITALGFWAMGGPGSQILQAIGLMLMILPIVAWDRWFQQAPIDLERL